jgi:hypothetical protein
VVNSAFVDDAAELTPWINNTVAEEYDLVVSTFEHYYVNFFSFTLTGGQSGNSQSLSALTGGFYKDNTLEKDPGTSSVRVIKRLPAFTERAFAQGITYDIIGTPASLYVYAPEVSAGNYRLCYTPDPPVLATSSPGPQVDLDATLTRWYQYVVKRAALDVFRKRQKLDELSVLAGDINNPMPGTLAYERQRILSMAHNKLESPQQVPLPGRRNTFWNWDDNP